MHRNFIEAAADTTRILRFRACDDNAMTIEAGAPASDGQPAKLPQIKILAYTGGEIRVGFGYPVVIDLAGMSAKGNRPVLRDHDPNRILGHTESIENDGKKLRIVGVASGNSTEISAVMESKKNGFPWQASVGAFVEKMSFVSEGEKAEANGKTFKGPIYLARRSSLREVSIVSLGADDDTSASVAAALAVEAHKEDSNMEFSAWLKARGFDIEKLTDEQKATLQAAFDAESKAAVGAGEGGKASDPAGEMRVQAAAEAKRIAAIVKEVADPEIRAKAIAEGWTLDKAQLEEVRAKSASLNIIARDATPAVEAPVIEAAICLRHGIGKESDLLAKHGDKVMNRADELRRSMSILRAIEITARMAGRPLPEDRSSHDFIRAAFSNQALTGILGNVANKALASGFAAVRPVSQRIAKAVPVTNFHTQTVYSMSLNGDLEEVAPDGEVKDLSLGEESYTRKAGTRGGKIGISRTDMINDNLSAFVDMGNRLGRKASTARERLLGRLINTTGAGSAHFTTARGNYFEGASTNLQLSSLATAVQKFRDQTGPDGDPVAIEPRILLVPTALEETAKALMDRSAALIAVALGATNAAKKEPSANVFAGQFEVVVSEWLSKTLSGQAGSSLAWYLLADPADVAAFEVSYLNGVQTPVVDFFGIDSSADVLGVIWRVYYDIGVNFAEYRGGVKSKGAA